MLFVAHLCWGQIIVRVLNYRPTGEFGFVMKAMNAIEVGAQQPFSKRLTKRWRGNMSLLYLNMKPRLEIFPVVGFTVDSKGRRVIPGLQTFNKYRILQFIIGYDYAIIHKEKFNFYAGADMVAGRTNVDYILVYPTWKNEMYEGGDILAGLRLRLGIDYNITQALGIFINANREGFFIAQSSGIFGANDYGLGMRYSFN